MRGRGGSGPGRGIDAFSGSPRTRCSSAQPQHAPRHPNSACIKVDSGQPMVTGIDAVVAGAKQFTGAFPDIKGRGQLMVSGNVYVVGDVTYADAPGKFEVSVSVTLARPVRKVDEGALKWGNLKVTSTSTETLGPAIQKFVIEVGG
jgi:hypothetical protein